ncbi:MAG: hypothetical protein NVSMB12_18880 [Acidimicrobiales bacterium]
MSRIAVIGTGYVGLTTGAYLAHIGHQVVCADVIAEKVERLSRGDIPIFETGLDEMVRGGLDSGNLRFVLGSAEAVAGAEFVFLCLPTPQGEDGSADLSYVRAEAERLGPLLDPMAIVINKSTVPVGSTRMVERTLARGDVFVVSNPEFLREGTALHDSLNPDRIVIGADDAAAASRVAGLYERLHAPVLVTDPASAELIKYASNAFLATKVSYINAIANLCEVVGADVKEVVLGMGYDKRIGFEFLRPGPGWGGSCFHPDETLLVRRGDAIRLLSFGELFAQVEQEGPDGWETLTWDAHGVGPEFRSIAAFTCRDNADELVALRTKMGRRILVTPDHPVVASGDDLAHVVVKAAADVTTDDWLPIADGGPALDWDDAWGLPLGAGWFEHGLRLGRGSNDKAVPDGIWLRPDRERRALLRGLWDGDGSWSYVAGGPSIVFEYGTTSRRLADGMLRLLGSLGICARLKVGRTPKSRSDAYWLTISGADQLEQCLWLFPEPEQLMITASLGAQRKRIAPTGYRSAKNAHWVRVVGVERVPYTGPVFSVEVPSTGTVVSSNGLVVHNCFPKDTKALVHIAEDAGYAFGLLEGVIDVNVEQYERIAAKIQRAARDGVLEGKTVAVWGLTFKAMTDDLRDSPSIEVIRRLRERGARVQAFDPMVDASRAAAHPHLSTLTVTADPYAACAGAELVALLTEWDEFRWLDFDKVKAELDAPTVVDCRNLLDPAAMRRRGFTYVGVGRA